MSQPTYTVGGQPVSQTNCGQTIEFDVPGYSRAWIIIAQNGNITFDAPMDLPMPPYQLKCPQDVGTFQVSANEITAQGTRGGVIGATVLVVGTELQQPQTPTGGGPPIGSGGPAPPTTGTGPSGGSGSPPIIPVGGSGGAPIGFEGGDTTEAGFFSGMDATTLILIGIGALLLLPQLMKQKRG